MNKLIVDTVAGSSPGAKNLRNELIDAMLKNIPDNHEIILVVPHDDKITDKTNLKIVRHNLTGGWRGHLNWYSKDLPELAEMEKASAVYTMFGLLWPKVAQKFPYVCSVNNMLPFTPDSVNNFKFMSKPFIKFKVLRQLYTQSLKAAGSVIMHSQFALDLVSESTGDIKDKSFVALTGVPKDMPVSEAKNSNHPYDATKYILYFSPFRAYKNHLRLVDAYAEALKENENLPDMVFAGIVADEAQLGRVKEKIRTLKLEDKVVYAGVLPKEDIPAWLYHAEFNVYPSEIECNSSIISEILSSGGVVSCSRDSSMDEVAGYACDSFDPFSVESMKKSILELSQNEDRLIKLREDALKRVNEFSWDECGKTIWKAVNYARENF